MSGYCFGKDKEIEKSINLILKNPTKNEIEKLLALNRIDCLSQLTQIVTILKSNLTHYLCPTRLHASTRNKVILKQEFEIIEETIEDFKSVELEKIKEF